MNKLRFEVVSFNQSSDQEIIYILKDIDISEVPTAYIEMVHVAYTSGETKIYYAEDFASTFPVNGDFNNDSVLPRIDDIEHIRIYIDTILISEHINFLVDDLFSRTFKKVT